MNSDAEGNPETEDEPARSSGADNEARSGPGPSSNAADSSDPAGAVNSADAAADGTSGDDASSPDGGSAQLIAGGILFSRLTGLVRERVFARFFGTSLQADVFRAALRMPNLLQNLLGEGTLSASFIPVYSELLEQGKEKEAGRVAGAIFSILLALAGGIVLVGVLFAPFIVDVFTPGFEGLRRELTISSVRIIFPMTGILVLSAWALGVLNSHRHFFLPYFAPVLWNVAMIATMLFFGTRMGQSSLVIALAWGALAGGALQFGVQLPSVLRLERELNIRWDTKLPRVREAVRNAGPAILGRGVVQVSGYVDIVLASLLAAGAVAILGYATTLYILPVSLFGMSVAAAELPELSRKRGSGTEVLRKRVNAGLYRIAFYVVPSFVGYLVLGDVVVAALYQTGDFSPLDTVAVYYTLAAFSLGLVASTGTRLFSSAYFALHDTITPAKFAAIRVVIAAGLGALLMFQFAEFGVPAGAASGLPFGIGGVDAAGPTLGTVGLGIGASVGAWVEWWLLRRNLKPRIGWVGAGTGKLARMFIAAGIAAVLARGLEQVLPTLHPIVMAVVVLGTFALLYFGGALLFGLHEATAAIHRVFGRFMS